MKRPLLRVKRAGAENPHPLLYKGREGNVITDFALFLLSEREFQVNNKLLLQNEF